MPLPDTFTKANPRAGAQLRDRAERLGDLAELLGTWVGKGFNLIALPNFNERQDPTETRKFRVKVNATQETLTFSSIGTVVPNRGNVEKDLGLFGLHYLQVVDDANGGGALHLEPGLWLTPDKPSADADAADETDPTPERPIFRLATIPHGDSLLAQGVSFKVKGGPRIDVDGSAESTPFTLNDKGERVNDTSEAYLAPYKEAATAPILPPGIRPEAIKIPNLVLQDAIADQRILKTTVLIVSATPVGGINGTPVTSEQGTVGGIVNTPFVVKNANANSMSATFWIEWVQRPDGEHFMQLQYTQTVILDFPVPGPDGKLVDIKWPHISVATLLKR